MASFEACRHALDDLASVTLLQAPTPVQELIHLRAALRSAPRLLIKRDDLIGFGFGGNKVRKLELVAARALEEGADTLVTTGGAQSNHARVTAAVAARLGMRCVLVLSGAVPARLTGNALLATRLGAEIHYVPTRADRSPAMGTVAERLADQGHRPFVIPLGASTPLGALGYARAVEELLDQIGAPDVIVHSTSSGGTQAGLIAGCALHGLATRVLGISADDSAAIIQLHVRGLLEPIASLLGCPGELAATRPIEVDDRFVGAGYGVPTPASEEALERLARTEGIFLDPTYTAKAMAGLLAHVREGRFPPTATVLFWHTGGLPGLFSE